MKVFFKYELKNVSINGTLVENAMIVNHVRNGNNAVENEIEVSEKNRGLSIFGMRYNQETDEFENIDEVKEPTQLDRIESQLLDIQAYQVEQAYEAAMAEIEGE